MNTWYLIAFVLLALVILYPADAAIVVRWIELQFALAGLSARKLWLFILLTPRLKYDQWRFHREVQKIRRERDKFNGDKND